MVTEPIFDAVADALYPMLIFPVVWLPPIIKFPVVCVPAIVKFPVATVGSTFNEVSPRLKFSDEVAVSDKVFIKYLASAWVCVIPDVDVDG